MSHKDNETTQSSLSAEAGVSCRPKQDSSDTVEFSVGNPRVEHITGLVHLYRKVNPQQESESNSFPGALPEERSNRLCILKLPDDLSVAEFCQFLGAHLSKVREMRFVRRETPAVYQPSMVLMRFDEQDTADTFFAEYSRKPFSSLEPDVVCTLVYVKDVEVLSGESLELSPPPGQTELPTCPVCLERLDEHISGVITTVCNHRFHNECLQRWADSSCPVCRYVQQSPNSSHCATCGSRENLWICLICGHVGCGRYMEAHAADHFRESGHCYSLELETQRVWDYVGDGYVHRLIRSHVDGKLVEVPSPSLGGMDPSCEECCQSSDPYMRELEEAQLASKLDAIAQEYNHLLASQLDSQRSYFEAQVAAAGREAEERASAADSKAAEMSARASKAEAEARDAANRSRLVQRKLQVKISPLLVALRPVTI